MRAILQWYRLLKLKLRACVLRAELDHAEGLMADHKRRYMNTLRELSSINRRIMAMEKPEVLLKNVA